eukprot:scaffold10715_cov114-Isochrysis_galbana.AAC.21
MDTPRHTRTTVCGTHRHAPRTPSDGPRIVGRPGVDADGDEPHLGVGESVESVSSGPDIVAVMGWVSFDLYHVTANGHGAPSDEADADQTQTNTHYIS